MKIIFIQWTSRKRTFNYIYPRSETASDFETLSFLEFFVIIKQRTNEIKFWIIIFHLLRIEKKVQIFEAWGLIVPAKYYDFCYDLWRLTMLRIAILAIIIYHRQNRIKLNWRQTVKFESLICKDILFNLKEKLDSSGPFSGYRSICSTCNPTFKICQHIPIFV